MKSKQIIHEEDFFHDLFMDYYPSLLSFARYYVPNEAVVEDLVQDVFVKMWELRGQWGKVENFSAYVYQMVRFRCFNYLRGEKLRGEMMRSYKEEKMSVVEVNQYIEEEIFRLVNQAMAALPSTYKQVITLSMEGYRVKEIAEKLNIGEETVKKRKQIAKQVLKEKLGKLYLFLFPLI
ncbi:RNA polymerase sigma factor [Butyricimonas paravirosa]